MKLHEGHTLVPSSMSWDALNHWIFEHPTVLFHGLAQVLWSLPLVNKMLGETEAERGLQSTASLPRTCSWPVFSYLHDLDVYWMMFMVIFQQDQRWIHHEVTTKIYEGGISGREMGIIRCGKLNTSQYHKLNKSRFLMGEEPSIKMVILGMGLWSLWMAFRLPHSYHNIRVARFWKVSIQMNHVFFQSTLW